MNGLPTSFFIVAAFLVFAIGLISYFVSKKFLFQRHKRRGEEALQQGDYLTAIQSFGRAEALWELNVSKQTTLSYQCDLTILEEILNGLEVAARASGVTLTVGEYRDAVKAVQSVFAGKEDSDGSSSGKTYASAFMRLKNAQSTLRQQLRENSRWM